MKGICVSKRLLFINILCLLWLPNFCDIKNEVDSQGVQANKDMPNVIIRTDDVPSLQEEEIHQQQSVVNVLRPNVEYVNKVDTKNIVNNNNDVNKLESPKSLSKENHPEEIITNLDSSRHEEISKKDESLLRQESLSLTGDSSSDHITDTQHLEKSTKHSDSVLPPATEEPEKIIGQPEVEKSIPKPDSIEPKIIPRPASPVNVKPVKTVMDDNLQHHHPHYDGMPSFDEWKKMMLAEQEKGGQKPPSPSPPGKKISSQKRRRNYSSYECGAKIVASNTEAEGTSRILNELVDEYMLNPCKAKIWFVIELCETVQANQIELANFELFSSCPKDFTVYSSDNFPTRDWVPLGTFTAAEQRILQSFELKQEGFGKFIKIELLSYYGTEHYCPLSVVRIFGTSMVDEYEEMETLSNHVDATEDDLDRLDIVIEDQKPTNLLGSATDAVMNIVKKAAQALGQHQASDEMKGNETVKDQQNVSEAQLCSVADQSQNKCEPVPIKTDSDTILSPHQFPIISSSMHHSLFRRLHRCDQCSSRIRYYSSAQPHCRFFQAALGPVVFQALCDWFKEHPVVIAQESSSHRNKVPLPNIDSSIFPTKSPPPQVMRVAIENELPWKKLISNDTVPLGPINVTNNSSSNNSYSSLNIIANLSIGSDKIDLEGTPHIVSITSFNESEGFSGTPELSGTVYPLHDTTETSSSQPSQITSTETTVPEDQTVMEASKILPSNIESSILPDDLSESEVEQIAGMPDTLTASEDVTEPLSVTEIPVEFKPTVERPMDVRTEFQGKVEPVGISSVGQKESVFMRMSNRIKALEINMSLSSQYLQELSQRYRRQMEEMQRAFNRTIGTLNDTARKAAERDLKQQDILNNLQLQVANLSQTVDMLVQERSTVFRQMIETHVGLMVIEAIIMITIMSLCVRRISSSAGQIPLPAKETVVATRVSKRRSSVDSCSPPVARKVKKRSASEEALNAGELLIVEPLPVLIDPILKAKKKNRKRSKAILRSNSNPTSNNSTSTSHSILRPTSRSDTYIQASDKPNLLSHESSSKCENCNDNTCTVVKAPDKERRLNGAPFQNLTNGSVIRPRESQTESKSFKAKERFSFKKFLKFQKRDSI